MVRTPAGIADVRRILFGVAQRWTPFHSWDKGTELLVRHG
jgi:hypothetical protein